MTAWPSARSRSGSAPDPARPDAFSASGRPPGGATTARRSPPIPHMCWVVTASTALVATAASAALPPIRSMATPAWAARWSTAQTMPWRARQVDAGCTRMTPPYCRPGCSAPCDWL